MTSFEDRLWQLSPEKRADLIVGTLFVLPLSIISLVGLCI